MQKQRVFHRTHAGVIGAETLGQSQGSEREEGEPEGAAAVTATHADVAPHQNDQGTHNRYQRKKHERKGDEE